MSALDRKPSADAEGTPAQRVMLRAVRMLERLSGARELEEAIAILADVYDVIEPHLPELAARPEVEASLGRALRSSLQLIASKLSRYGERNWLS